MIPAVQANAQPRERLKLAAEVKAQGQREGDERQEDGDGQRRGGVVHASSLGAAPRLNQP